MAHARGSHIKPVVPRPADEGRQTPAWRGKEPSNTSTSSMKTEEINADTGPNCESSHCSVFAKCFDVSGLGDLVVTFFLRSEQSEARWLEE